MSDFYSAIASRYDRLFPTSPAAGSFISSLLPEGGSILDVGCGTGNLLLSLDASYNRLCGIDLDELMIEKARDKAEKRGHTAEFRVLDMLSLESTFSPGSFDLVLCLGNTLPHLAGIDEISCFIRQVRSVLSGQGRLVLQFVNFRRIIDQDIRQLPLIERDGIRFERYYDYNSFSNRISFRAVLSEGDRELENTTELYPLTVDDIKQLLAENGLKVLDIYSDLKENEFTADNTAVVLNAVR